VQEQHEVWMQTQFLVSHLDVLVLTSLDNGTRVHWSNDSIDTVLQVLKHDWVSNFKGKFNGLDHLWVAQSGNLQVVGCFLLLDPDDTLKLWINNQWISL